MTVSTHNFGPVTFAVAGALTMMAHQVGAKSVRDSLFLSNFDVAQLPLMVIVSSLFSLILVFPASWAASRFTPGRVIPWMFFGSAAFYGVVWLVGDREPEVTSVVVFLAVVGFSGLLTSGYWALISERLDPYSVKKAVGRIGAGGSVGVAAGGLLTERVGATFDATAMLLLLAALHLICGLFALALKASSTPDSANPESGIARMPRSILKLIREAPYLRILAALVLLSTISAGMIDYVFKAESAARFADKEMLLRFFAAFYAVTGVATFVIQTLVSRKALEHFGLAKTVGAAPLSVVAGGLGAMLFPGLASAAVARGSESIFRGSLFRSGYELFYAPIPAEEKRATKPILDVGFDRLGDAAAGGAVKVILFLAPAIAMNVILSVAVLISIAGLWIALQLQEAYRDALERNLMGRRESLQQEDEEEGSILASMVMTQVTYVAPLGDDHPSGGEYPRASIPDLDDVAATVSALDSGEQHRVFPVLARWSKPPAYAVAHLIPLLDSAMIYREVLRVLRAAAPHCTGQLIDALVSPETPETVRRRLPRALRRCQTQRCLDGLILGLEDESFDVRYSCGRVLAALHRSAPELRIDEERVLAVVKSEATLGRSVWEAYRDNRDNEMNRAGQLAQELLEDAGARVLEHIFRILTLVVPWEPMQVAYYGLHTDDSHLRGTTLEYLEGVLPADVRQQLWPYLEDPRVKEKPRGTAEAALKELLRTHTRMGSELDQATRLLSDEDAGDD